MKGRREKRDEKQPSWASGLLHRVFSPSRKSPEKPTPPTRKNQPKEDLQDDWTFLKSPAEDLESSTCSQRSFPSLPPSGMAAVQSTEIQEQMTISLTSGTLSRTMKEWMRKESTEILFLGEASASPLLNTLLWATLKSEEQYRALQSVSRFQPPEGARCLYPTKEFNPTAYLRAEETAKGGYQQLLAAGKSHQGALPPFFLPEGDQKRLNWTLKHAIVPELMVLFKEEAEMTAEEAQQMAPHRSYWGKTLLFRGAGKSLRMDRIFLKQRLQQITEKYHTLVKRCEIGLPCGVLDGKRTIGDVSDLEELKRWQRDTPDMVFLALSEYGIQTVVVDFLVESGFIQRVVANEARLVLVFPCDESPQLSQAELLEQFEKCKKVFSGHLRQLFLRDLVQKRGLAPEGDGEEVAQELDEQISGILKNVDLFPVQPLKYVGISLNKQNIKDKRSFEKMLSVTNLHSVLGSIGNVKLLKCRGELMRASQILVERKKGARKMSLFDELLIQKFSWVVDEAIGECKGMLLSGYGNLRTVLSKGEPSFSSSSSSFSSSCSSSSSTLHPPVSFPPPFSSSPFPSSASNSSPSSSFSTSNSSPSSSFSTSNSSPSSSFSPPISPPPTPTLTSFPAFHSPLFDSASLSSSQFPAFSSSTPLASSPSTSRPASTSSAVGLSSSIAMTTFPSLSSNLPSPQNEIDDPMEEGTFSFTSSFPSTPLNSSKKDILEEYFEFIEAIWHSSVIDPINPKLDKILTVSYSITTECSSQLSSLLINPSTPFPSLRDRDRDRDRFRNVASFSRTTHEQILEKVQRIREVLTKGVSNAIEDISFEFLSNENIVFPSTFSFSEVGLSSSQESSSSLSASSVCPPPLLNFPDTLKKGEKANTIDPKNQQELERWRIMLVSLSRMVHERFSAIIATCLDSLQWVESHLLESTRRILKEMHLGNGDRPTNIPPPPPPPSCFPSSSACLSSLSSSSSPSYLSPSSFSSSPPSLSSFSSVHGRKSAGVFQEQQSGKRGRADTAEATNEIPSRKRRWGGGEEGNGQRPLSPPTDQRMGGECGGGEEFERVTNLSDEEAAHFFSPLYFQHFTREQKGAVTKLVSSSQLVVQEICRDPSSQFRALSLLLYGSEDGFEALRILAMAELAQHPHHYENLICHPRSHPQQYLTNMLREETMGDYVSLLCLSTILRAKIYVFSPAFEYPVSIPFSFGIGRGGGRGTEEEEGRGSSLPSPLPSSSPAFTFSLLLEEDLTYLPLASSQAQKPAPDDFGRTSPSEERVKKRQSSSAMDEMRQKFSAVSISDALLLGEGGGEGVLNRTQIVYSSSMGGLAGVEAGEPAPLTLVSLCVSKLAQYAHRISVDVGSILPEELVHRILKSVRYHRNLTPFVLHRFSGPHLVDLDLSDLVPLQDGLCAVAASPSLENLEKIQLSRSSISVPGFQQMFVSPFPRLTEIDFQECPAVTNQVLSLLASKCPLLTSINLRGCVEISDFGLVELFKHTKGLKHLVLRDCQGVVGECVPHLPLGLESLDVVNCSLDEDHLLQLISSTSGRLLLVLKMGWGGVVSDAVVGLVGRNCGELEELEIQGAGKITKESIVALSRGCRKLQELAITNAEVEEDSVWSAIQWERIRSLDLTGCSGISGSELEAMGRSCRGLTSLTLSSCDEVAPQSLSSFFGRLSQSLTSLDLSRCAPLSDSILTILLKVGVRLERANLSYCQNITDEGIHVLVQSSPNLQYLDISGCQISDAAFTSIAAHCLDLRVLICEETPVTDSGMKGISRSCSLLRRLQLAHCGGVTDQALEYLCIGCPFLSFLDVSYCGELTSRGLQQALCMWSNMTELHLRGFNKPILDPFRHPSLRVLALSWNSSVTDATLTSLIHSCPNLEQLDVRYCSSITSKGLRSLVGGLRRLRLLNVRGVPTQTASLLTSVRSKEVRIVK